MSSIVLLLGWAANTAATTFESLTTGSAQPTAGGAFLNALGRFTAPPDFAFNFHTNFTLLSGISCDGVLAFGGCQPDSRLSVSVVASGSDVIGGLTHAGVTMPTCDAGGPFRPGQNPCASFDVRLGWRAVLPPFTGEAEATVAGEFGAFIGLRILEIGDFGEFSVFTGAGPALLSVGWHEDTSSWFLSSAEGHILEPTPEPATLLLVGTTAAGLGLARWYRRRGRERALGA